jgi:hypothetical protein
MGYMGMDGGTVGGLAGLAIVIMTHSVLFCIPVCSSSSQLHNRARIAARSAISADPDRMKAPIGGKLSSVYFIT